MPSCTCNARIPVRPPGVPCAGATLPGSGGIGCVAPLEHAAPELPDAQHLAARVKAHLSIQVQAALAAQALTKSALARRMGTSRSVIDRLLCEHDTALTLATLANVAAALQAELCVHLSWPHRQDCALLACHDPQGAPCIAISASHPAQAPRPGAGTPQS